MYASRTRKCHAVAFMALSIALLLTFALPCVGAREEREFRDLSSEEMKAALQDKKYLDEFKGLPDEVQRIVAAVRMGVYQCKLLAEQYFAAMAEDRKRLAGDLNAGAARDVAYEIAKTPQLGWMGPPLRDEKMDMAWLNKQVQGPYEGLFLVKPADGGALEQYHMVFGVAEGRRYIEKVEKDADFDAAVYARNIEKMQIVAWTETALKGSHERVLGQLPKAEYPYLSGPVFEQVEMDVDSLSPSGPLEPGEPAVSNWKGYVLLFFKPETSEFRIAERLLVEMAKKGDSISIIKCQRDEEFAQTMAEKVQAAEFIVAYVQNPEKRAKWLAPGGLDELPKGATLAPIDRQNLPLNLRERRRIGPRFGAGDPGEGPLFEALCFLTLEGGRRSQYQYLFRLVKPPRAKEPLMIRVGEARLK